MATFYILLGLAIVFSAIFIGLWSRERALCSFFLKGLATTSVIALAVYTISLSSINTITILLIIGLCLCMLGDLALALLELCGVNLRANIITCGTIAFAMAQILFIIMLSLLDLNTLFGLIFGIIFAGAIFLLKKPMKLEFGKSLTPSLIYGALLGSNVAGSIIFMIVTNFSTLGILLAIGFLMFVISDLILSKIYFGGNNKPITQKVNYITYYVAIILLALSFVAIV